jgi:flotillin
LRNLKISLLLRQKTVLEAEAEAEAIALRGDAKAFAVEAKAKAEAEQMAKKADAWNEYGKAALMDMMLKVKFFIRFHLRLETV